MVTITCEDFDAKPERTHREGVTASHFGINLVASAIPAGFGSLTDSALGRAIAGLAPGTLRYPGGTVTEVSFDMARPDGPGRDGLPLIAQSDAIAFAAATGVALDIVLPTRTGFAVSAARRGFVWRDLRLVLLPDTQVFRKRPPRADARLGRALATFADLRVGDYVVHEDHGVGKLLGFETKEVAGVTRDYLFLAFRGCQNARTERSFTNYVSDLSALTVETKQLSDQFFGARLDSVGNSEQRQRPFARRGLAPTLVGGGCRVHRRIDVGLCRERRSRVHLTGDRVDHIGGATIGRLDMLTIDEVLERLHADRILLCRSASMRSNAMVASQMRTRRRLNGAMMTP